MEINFVLCRCSKSLLHFTNGHHVVQGKSKCIVCKTHEYLEKYWKILFSTRRKVLGIKYSLTDVRDIFLICQYEVSNF